MYYPYSQLAFYLTVNFVWLPSVEEVEGAHGQPPSRVLRRGVRLSPLRYLYLCRETPTCLLRDATLSESISVLVGRATAALLMHDPYIILFITATSLLEKYTQYYDVRTLSSFPSLHQL